MNNPADADRRPRHLVIHIDRRLYRVDERSLTGDELRDLPDPAIGPEYILWLEVPGRDDIEVGDTESIKIRNGMHFYSALRNQNPG